MSPGLSHADHRHSPPTIDVPRNYNAAWDLIARNIETERAGKTAYIDDRGSYTFADLDERSAHVAAWLRATGIRPEQRILVCMLDSFELPSLFLGAIRAGVIPVLVNTLLVAEDYRYMLRDSRAQIAVVSEPLMGNFQGCVEEIAPLQRILSSTPGGEYEQCIDEVHPDPSVEPTIADDACFWLYSSGSTGAPKGTVHLHSSLIATAELYAKPVLGIEEGDTVFSAAKLFFAYGLGNALTFPLSVGATTVLMAERPTPQAVFRRLVEHQPTIFYGVPTLYAALLADPNLPAQNDVALRRCTSAGEALPKDLGERWSAHFGVDILDGIGSTEMLHIFLSNAPEDLEYGTTGKPVPGYTARLVGDDGQDVAPGEIGELHVAGPTSAAMYWNNRAKSRQTFLGDWTRTGDKYLRNESGYYVYCGRSDDMLKVGGIYVSPTEVESALIGHEAVLEAAVVGKADEENLIKPAAFVVLTGDNTPGEELMVALQAHVKHQLAPYKYPRWIEFVSELPKTATGKIQRFKLR
ncbi:MAG: benzoate-CoA ligase family protein [Pseudomonadota bacterium]